MNMLFALFLLIQSPEPGHLSKLVIIGVALFLIIGVTGLVYFLRRLKSSEKQAEEDWGLSRSLFQEPAPTEPEVLDTPNATSQATPADEPDEEQWAVKESSPTPTATLVSPTSPAPRESNATRILSSEPRVEPTPAPRPVTQEPVTPIQAESVTPEERKSEAPSASNATELLVSPAQTPSAPPEPQASQTPSAPIESAPFDDGVWAELRDSVAPAPPAQTEPTRPFGASSIEQVNARLDALDEANAVARVDQHADRAPFEPPTITPLAQRLPFEPPTITPITPRQQSEMMAEKSTPPPPDLYDRGSSGGPSAPTTNLYSQSALRDAQSQRAADEAERHTRELVTPAASIGTPAADADDWAAVSAASVSAVHERRTPAGAVLGLPVNSGGGPLVLGQPVKNREDIGIGSLSTYGKPPAKEGGKGGTIALLLVVLIFGGAIAAYLFSPPFHAKVNGWVARVRGEDPDAAVLTPDPKLMVFPSRNPETDKSTVKANGSVENISKETLENLSIEISLERSNGGAPEIRNVQITPSPLEPGGHGTYAFEYDGNQETGFGGGYKIKRALSNGTPIRFTAPGQK